MAYGSEMINGKVHDFGFADVSDWLSSVISSFPSPWRLAPLDGKYYGTVIEDARGKPILSVWRSVGEPSRREKGPSWTREAWEDYCSDSHWESEVSLALAEAVVSLRNAWDDIDEGELVSLIQLFFCWKEEAWPEISCGGPGRRALKMKKELRCPTT